MGGTDIVESDRGSAFNSALMKQRSTELGVDIGLHIAYHPQSLGQMETVDQTLKGKL